MSLCWKTDINSSTGSKDVIRSSIICKDNKLSQRSSLKRLAVSTKPSGDPLTVQCGWRTTSHSSSTAAG
ncbi:hypothetical protein CHARACLAT_033369 [Characodon lateralis]|uniref:Uncharacterized protein n=1 Tax=Characodon lateralis TaxID=208331 RepID=A0ABU7F1F8_9TELE|nr:hypothetical protein [Characodon lateralis]